MTRGLFQAENHTDKNICCTCHVLYAVLTSSKMKAVCCFHTYLVSDYYALICYKKQLTAVIKVDRSHSWQSVVCADSFTGIFEKQICRTRLTVTDLLRSVFYIGEQYEKKVAEAYVPLSSSV